MGATKVGDIKEICDIVKPQIGIITAIGPQHLESFKNIDNVIKTKFELAEAVKENGGTIFINNSKIKDITYFSNILTNISLIDLYLERLVKKNYISLSTSNKIAVKLTEINKMCNAWRKNNEES